MSDPTSNTDLAIAAAKDITAKFDPHQYVRQLSGKGGPKDYLDVAFRVLWFRKECPDGVIVTEHIELSDSIAIFKATIERARKTDADGTIHDTGRATGYGSETPGHFPDYIEKAETKAVGRALNALGYGVQFIEDEAVDSTPVARRSSAKKPAPAKPPATKPAGAVAVEPSFGDRVKDAATRNSGTAWKELFELAGDDRGKWAVIIANSPTIAHVERISQVIDTLNLMNPALLHSLETREKHLKAHA